MNWDDMCARREEYAERCHSDWMSEERSEVGEDDDPEDAREMH